jgi:hypothetical protein
VKLKILTQLTFVDDITPTVLSKVQNAAILGSTRDDV